MYFSFFAKQIEKSRLIFFNLFKQIDITIENICNNLVFLRFF